MKLLKQIIHLIAVTLVYTYSTYFYQLEFVPICLGFAQVIPFDPTLVKNYHPISVLPAIIQSSRKVGLQATNFDSSQFGFRKIFPLKIMAII